MANNDTRQTLDALRGVNNGDNNGRRTIVDEGNGLTVGQGRKNTVMDEKPKYTTIDELNQAFLTPDERAQQEDNINSPKKTAKMKRGNTDRQRPSDDEGKIFEEGDIIDWMFRNIIVSSMNWTGNKIVNWSSFIVGYVATETVDYIGKKVSNEAKDYKDAIAWINPYKGGFAKYPESNTTKFQEQVNELRNKEIADSQQFNTPNNRQLLETSMTLLHDGKINEFNQMMHNNISPETIEALNNIPSEQLQILFSPEHIHQTSANMINTLMASQQYAANVATARLLQEQAEKSGAHKNTDVNKDFDQYYTEAKADYLAYMKEAQAAGKDPMQAVQELNELSIAACKHVNEQIDHYQYNEVGNKPAENKALQKIDELTNFTKESPYRGKTELDDFAAKIINVSKEHDIVLAPISRAEADLRNRSLVNNQRRQRLAQTFAAIRSHPEQIRYAAQQRQGGR